MTLQKVDLGSIIGPQGPKGDKADNYAFTVEDGNLYVVYEDREASPQFSINNDGHLTIPVNGTVKDLGQVVGPAGDMNFPEFTVATIENFVNLPQNNPIIINCTGEILQKIIEDINTLSYWENSFTLTSLKLFGFQISTSGWSEGTTFYKFIGQGYGVRSSSEVCRIYCEMWIGDYKENSEYPSTLWSTAFADGFDKWWYRLSSIQTEVSSCSNYINCLQPSYMSTTFTDTQISVDGTLYSYNRNLNTSGSSFYFETALDVPNKLAVGTEVSISSKITVNSENYPSTIFTMLNMYADPIAFENTVFINHHQHSCIYRVSSGNGNYYLHFSFSWTITEDDSKLTHIPFTLTGMIPTV